MTFESVWNCSPTSCKCITVASMPVFLDITSYWSQTDMRKIDWFEKNKLVGKKELVRKS